MGSGTIEELDAADPLALDPRRGLSHPGIVALGQHDAALQAPRPLGDAGQKTHLANLRFRAFCTAGCTSAETSPPKRATSRTRLELR